MEEELRIPKCETLLPKEVSKYILPSIVGVTVILVGLLTMLIGVVAYIGLIIGLMLIMGVSNLEKCWDTKRVVLHFTPYILFSIVFIVVVIMTNSSSLRMLGMTEEQAGGTFTDLTYAFTNFWALAAAVVASGGAPAINFTASIVMYGVAAFMLIYGDRMENSIIMLGGTLMLFAPMILGLTTVLLTGYPIGFFSDFARGFMLFGPAGRIVMSIVCIIPDALIISVLMTIEKLIPEPGEAEEAA